MKTGRYSLKQLLTHNEIEQIIIPEIQRDYVWEVSNVKKLIGDILKSFKKKSSHQIEIKVNGKDSIPESITHFLSQEYERLVYQQKLGFIYAYHDRDYAGKFFLIDGQQRITTLYLMLLYLYSSTDKVEEFKTLYFNNEIPKVDYKVREQSHDFLHLLIKSFLNGKEYKDSEAFYSTEYLKDTTIKHLIENFEFIRLALSNIENKLDFLNYLENFVEVNYFDTHLSEQGEQLYIYMNSRGEQLSHQEIIRAELMQKVSDATEKIELGKEWEKWQNFFWKHRGGNNENADNGFEEFLKWAVVIHLSINEDLYLENFVDSSKTYTIKQLKENYIRDSYKGEQLKNQKEAIFKYQVKYLDFEFLKKLFDAIDWVYHNKTKYIPVQDIWLSNKIGVLDYVIFLPILYYQMINKWDDNAIKTKDIEQLTMFLKNITFFEAISKNPDTATLDALEIVKKLDGNNNDIINILNQQNVTKTILTDAEKKKLELYQNEPTKRDKWERLIWDVTLNEDFSKFLMGDVSVIWKCIEKEKLNNPTFDSKTGFFGYKELIKDSIYKNRVTDKLKRIILCKFDYLIQSGSGGGLEKYSFIGNSSSWEVLREWKETIVKDDFIELLIWIKNKPNYELNELLLEAKKDFTLTGWIEAFIAIPALLKYCSNKKILWQDEHRILLLEKTNYSKTLTREIQCALLQNIFDSKGMWIFENDCCVLEFDWNEAENKIDFKGQGNNKFKIDLKYSASKKQWTFNLFHQEEKIIDLIDVSNNQEWGVSEERLTIGDSVLYNYDIQKTLLENNNELIKKLNNLISKIEDLLKILKNDKTN